MLIKRCNQFFQRQYMLVTTVAISLTIAITAKPAKSAVVALSDDNSIVAFDPDKSDNPANNGLILWTVDDVNQLFQNKFWYRVGSQSRENSLNTLNLIRLEQSQPADKQLSVAYVGSGFEVALDLTLDGGALGSGSSSLFENIRIKNTGSEQLDFHLFNYTDFDLNESGQQDTIKIGSNKAQQSDTFTWATEVIDPVASYYQVSPFANILEALEDDAPTTLNNFSGPLTGENSYAFQWDFKVESEKSFSIKNYKSIKPVPEPTIIPGLVVFGSFIWLWRSRQALRHSTNS
jgi:hypothetical protein